MLSVYFMTDLIFGMSSLYVSTKLYRMIKKREEFSYDFPQLMAILTAVAFGTFFIGHVVSYQQNVDYMHVTRAIAFAVIGVVAAVWFHFMTKKVTDLPSMSELAMMNRNLQREIEERKKTERKLIDVNTHLDQLVSSRIAEMQAIFDNSPLAMVKVDPAGKVLMWSRAAESLFGWTASEVLGKPVPIIPPEKMWELRENIEYTVIKKVPFYRETQRLCKNGKLLDVSLWNAPMPTPDGQDGALAIFADNTARVEVAKQMELTKKRAQEANQAKSIFLANISHEIRTPLNAIIGFSDLLMGDVPEEDRKKFIKTINSNAEFLRKLVNDMLDMSKIEAGKVKFETKTINLRDAIREIIETAAAQAIGKPIEIIPEIDDNVPEWIMTDPIRFRQILLNVVGNSTKFTFRGHVKIKITSSSISKTYNSDLLTIMVCDTGIGMTEQQVEKLFKPFAQAKLNTTRKFGGTGLGLLISKQLAQLMGGDVSVQRSAPDQGTDFLITIPVTVAARPAFENVYMNSNVTNLINGKNILVVDDSEDNLTLVSRILSKVGVQVATASDGIEGLEKASAGNFDVVLMDVEMPKMNGLEAMKKLRSKGYQPHIIALTGHAFEEEKEEILSAGFDDHISKPINRLELIRTIEKHVPKRSESAG
jgi:PAS domain S-box-containing protein